jgi:hypothetical protein
MRRAQGNAYEVLLSHSLLTANTAEPQKQIALICQAAMRCDFKSEEGKSDFKSLIYALSTLNTAVQFALKWVYEGREIYSVKWDHRLFTDASFYDLYIKEWDDKFDSDKLADAEIAKAKGEGAMFAARTRFLTPLGFAHLQSSFYSWAIPQAQNLHKFISFKIGAISANAAMQSSDIGGLKSKE